MIVFVDDSVLVGNGIGKIYHSIGNYKGSEDNDSG